jgi:diacylglycerol kinase family enzyme
VYKGTVTSTPLPLPALSGSPASDGSTARKSLLLITNPHASTVSPRLQRLVQHALAGQFNLECVSTEGRGHATELGKQAAIDGVDAVVVFSGDGTINEAANGVIGTKTALTTLPGGSGNVYNRILTLPPDVIDATERLLRRADDWQPRQVLMGVVNERRFLFSSGVGLDAAITGYVDSNPRWKHKFNERYFLYSALKVYFTTYLRNPPALETTWPGCEEPLHGITSVVQKGDPYTFFDTIPLRASAGARLEEPEFSGMSLKTARPTIVPGIAFRMFSQKHEMPDHRQINGFAGVPEVTIRSRDERAIDLHVDGDNIGKVTEAHYTIDPQPLTVLG